MFCVSGYGAIYPSTRAGRIATMVYATIGVPLFLLTMGKVGKLFTRAVKFLWSFIRKFYYMKHFRKIRKTKAVQTIANVGQITSNFKSDNEEDLDQDEDQQKNNSVSSSQHNIDTVDTVVNLDDATSYISFHIDDNFNLHPFVAILITMVYIILGAIMYVQWEKDWAYHDAFYFIFISVSTIGFGDLVPTHPKFFLLSSIYILFGLALVAMVINVLMEFFTETIQTVREHIHIPEILLHPTQIIGNRDGEDTAEASPKDMKSALGQIAIDFQNSPQMRQKSPPT